MYVLDVCRYIKMFVDDQVKRAEKRVQECKEGGKNLCKNGWIFFYSEVIQEGSLFTQINIMMSHGL